MRVGVIRSCAVGALVSCAIILPSHDAQAQRNERTLPSNHIVGRVRVAQADIDSALRANAILRTIDTANQSEVTLLAQHLQQAILALYRSRGFYKASIDSFRFAAGYTLYLTEGEEYIVRSVRVVDTAGTLNTSEIEELSSLRGSPFDAARAESIVTSVLQRRLAVGEAFARIVLTGTRLIESEGALDLDFTFIPGGIPVVEHISILGNSTTDRDVILREFGVEPGSQFEPARIADGRDRVMRLGYFSSVADPEFRVVSDSTIAIELRVQEKRSSFIDGLLGYVPGRTPEENGYLSGLADLRLRNILGTGRNASLYYSRETRETQEFRATYLEPWVAGLPINATLAYAQRQQDSSYSMSNLELAASVEYSRNLYVLASIGYQNTVPTFSESGANPLLQIAALTSSLAFKADTRDNTMTPGTGVLAILGVRYLNQTSGGREGVSSRDTLGLASASLGPLTALSLEMEAYTSPQWARRFTGALRLEIRSIGSTNSSPQQSDLFRIGGFRSIRGFRESQFLSDRYALLKPELRFSLGEMGYIAAFADAAYFSVPGVRGTAGSGTEQVKFVQSYGVGVVVPSPLGLLSFNFALPHGETLDQTKIHFGILSEF